MLPRFKAILISLGLIEILVGLAVLAGWHTGTGILIRPLSGSVPMAYSTALSLAGLGMSLVAIGLGRLRYVWPTACLAGAAAAVTLIETATNTSLGVNRLPEIMGLPSRAWNVAMAPNTAAGVALLAAALMLIGRGFFPNRPLLVAMLGSAALALGLISICGYLTGFGTFEWGQFTPMALHTSLGLSALGAGVLVYAWNDGPVRSRQPSWLFVTIAMAAVVMTISLWQALGGRDYGT